MSLESLFIALLDLILEALIETVNQLFQSFRTAYHQFTRLDVPIKFKLNNVVNHFSQ